MTSKHGSSRLFAVLPPHGRGQRIGVFGGSFNPPHAAHRLVSLIAMKRLNLDTVWWLVTPGNPLKDTSDLPSTGERVRAAQRVAAHPRIHVTALEEALGSRFTFDVLRHLTERAPSVRFVWIMGADNLERFHLWNRWQDIAHLMPIAVVDRPGATNHALRSRAAQAFQVFRAPEGQAGAFASRHAPALIILHGPRSTLSSTALRKRH